MVRGARFHRVGLETEAGPWSIVCAQLRTPLFARGCVGFVLALRHGCISSAIASARAWRTCGAKLRKWLLTYVWARHAKRLRGNTPQRCFHTKWLRRSVLITCNRREDLEGVGRGPLTEWHRVRMPCARHRRWSALSVSRLDGKGLGSLQNGAFFKSARKSGSEAQWELSRRGVTRDFGGGLVQGRSAIRVVGALAH